MKKFTLIIFTFLALSAQILIGQNAPISTISDVASTGNTITVPITVINFNDIGSCNIQLLYDPSIAICTGVALGPILSYGLAINISNPGIITIGWYQWPGVTGPDNSVLFELSFDKVSGGTSIIEWDDTYLSHQWSDGSSFPLNYLPFDDYHFDGSLTWQADAPITTVPVLTACANTAIDIPVTVKDFNDIGVISLTLHFNNLALTYQGFTNNSGFPGLFVFNPNDGVITAAGFTTSSGITLADDAVLFTIHCTFLGGTTNLVWYDDDGTSCEYGGPPPDYTVLNDIPTSTYYINGSITEDCVTEWTGNINEDWFQALNWTNGVPDATTNAIIPYVGPAPPYQPIIDGDAHCKDMDIHPSSSIRILEFSTFTAHGNINNDGDVFIHSSAIRDGSFIDNGTITGSGTATVYRYLEQNKWHYVSPPISDAKSGVFLDIYLRSFDEVTGIFSNIVPVYIDLNPMQGYASWADDLLTGTTTVSYIGQLNTGVVSNTTLTNTSTATHTHRGYNFVGNPYPSAIDWDAATGWTKTNLDNAIYFWNPEVGQYGSYVTYPPSGTNGADNIIPSGQGFFVHVTDGNPTGSISVNNNARLHSIKAFMKQSDTTQEQLTLQISTDLNAYMDQTIVQFDDNASVNFDTEMDALKMNGLEEAAGLNTLSADEVRLSINTYPKLDENIIIPLDCTIGTDGYYTIEAQNILNFTVETEILLEDNFEDVIINLTEQNAYTFYGSIADDPNRFNLHFIPTPNNTIEISDNQAIQVYASNKIVYLKRLDSNLLNGKIRVFDVLGRIIASESVQGIQQYELKLNNEGILLVSYFDSSEQKEYRQKIHLK